MRGAGAAGVVGDEVGMPDLGGVVADDLRDSILNLYRKLIRLRRENEALISGRLEQVAANGAILRYERRNDAQHFAILLNLGHAHEEATLAYGKVVASTYLDRENELIDGKVHLRPSEGIVVNVE